jgi:xanthine permease XanP
VDADLVTESASVTLTYNDLDLTVSIRYVGELVSLPNAGAGKHVLLEEESFSYGLADFLTGAYPDRMEARSDGQNAEVKLIFSAS